MDSRLLAAMNDVLTDAGIDVAVADSVAGEAGPVVRQLILNKAATGNASTGAPIPSLRGAAAQRATLAAVGGGAEAAGGDGMVGGQRVLDQAALQVQLASYGITAAAIVAQIGIRYAVLVRRDRKAAREAAADDD